MLQLFGYFIINVSFLKVTSGEWDVHPLEPHSISTSLQVLYRQNWHGRSAVLETNKTSVELQIPFGEDYLIEIKALTDGGDGTSSGPIRIPKMSSKFHTLSKLSNILITSIGIKLRSTDMGALGVTNLLSEISEKRAWKYAYELQSHCTKDIH